VVAVRSRRLDVRDLGLVDYARAEQLQEGLVAARLALAAPDTRLLLEHPPTITLGRRGSLADVFVTEAQRVRCGIALHHTSRGGLVTYHGPGQLVAYPILRPRDLGRTIPQYVRGLERTVVAALGAVGVAAHVDEAHVGVWTSRGKIAAIGVGQTHGVTRHGFAVNLQPELRNFALINPCGIGDLGVTSAATLLGRPVEMGLFKRLVADAFRAEFGYDWRDHTLT